MKKKWWIILIIAIVLASIIGWYCYALYNCVHYFSDKRCIPNCSLRVLIEHNYWCNGQRETQSECQDFIDECYKKNFEFWAWEWHVYFTYPDWSTSLDDKANCPEDCSRYTEKRWYFKDKQKQQEYYDNKVKECNKEYNKCIEKWGSIFSCHTCDEYWQPIYQWN